MPGFADDIGKLTPHLRRFARALVRGHGAAAADDLVQETIVAVGRAGLPKRGPVLMTQCFATLVRLNRGRENLGGAGQAGTEPLPFLPKDVVRLDSLSLDHREVLLLTVLSGLSYAQVGEVLGLDLATVMSRLTAARDGLARLDETGARTEVAAARRQQGASHLRLVK